MLSYFWLAVVRLGRVIVHPFKDKFGDILGRLKRHLKIANQTALASELIKAEEFRKGRVTDPS
jgi:hypothetical protein